METSLFKGQQRLVARALFIGQRLDLRAFEHSQRLAESPLVVSAGAGGAAVLFRYGAVVAFGLSTIEEVAFLEDIKPLVVAPFDAPETEEIVLTGGATGSERVEQGELRLHSFSIERVQLVANVLGKSVVLAHYEASVSASFDRIEPLAAELQRGGTRSPQGRELLVHIGETLIIHEKLVGRLEVLEKPELLWEHPELERLYLRLEDEYELRERHVALERKLELISRTAETLLSLLQNKRSLRVEWYIVILIVVEIILYAYDLLR
ncbi:MAG: RMD1 family protein [Gammaproteobacteria bacterium]